MNGGAARIERSTQRGTAHTCDIRDRTFAFGKFVWEGRDHHMRAGFYVDPCLKKPNAFGMRQAVSSDKGPQTVLSIQREIILHANTPACAERHSRAQPIRLSFGGRENLRHRRRIADPYSEAGHLPRDFQVLLE
jgi:hypothetical protein